MFGYYLSFGVLENHKDGLVSAIQLFSKDYNVKQWTPLLEGPAEFNPIGDRYINVGCYMDFDLNWSDFKSHLKSYQIQHLVQFNVDVDLMMQTFNGLTTIISPKAIHYTHSIMLLNQLNSGLIINKRPIQDWYAGKGNVHDFSFNKASFQISPV